MRSRFAKGVSPPNRPRHFRIAGVAVRPDLRAGAIYLDGADGDVIGRDQRVAVGQTRGGDGQLERDFPDDLAAAVVLDDLAFAVVGDDDAARGEHVDAAAEKARADADGEAEE